MEKLNLFMLHPERLENPEFATRLKSLNPQFLFIDEAHCISEWGHNFRPSYTKLKDFIEFTGIKKISAFTATATPEVVKDIIKQLGLKNPKIFIKGFERDNLYLNAEITKKKNERCLELFHQYKSPAIIYASSRKKTEELAGFLKINKVKCEYYHAGLDPIIRKKIQEDFIEGRLPLIIATNAFGMGIDKKDIRLVIHYNSPGSIENYYQEIGRAGRDGKASYTYLLYDESDVHIHNYFISNSYPTKEIIKKIYSALCDSAQIAIGMLSEKDIAINIEYLRLHTKQDISNSILNSSLKYLENAGYIKFNSAFRYSNKIKILFEQTRLKNFIKSTTNEFMREVLLNLIRFNGNEIFVKLVSVNLNQIQSETGLSNQEINETLTNLEFLGILEFSKPDGKETISLLKPRVRTEDLKLNYKLINELYISSKQKLDKMVDFVYTTECRFKCILKYFGEEAENYLCGKCDNCLNVTDLSDNSISYIKEKVLDLINETKTEKSENQIIDVLLGKNTDSGLTKSAFFSSLIHYKKNEIVQAIKILVAENKLHHRKEGKQKIFFVPINETSETESAININPDYERSLELFHSLREAREKAAKKFLQSGNIICSDFILGKIAQQKPKTKYELFSIPGFNERMFNKVGNDFLEIINSYSDVKDGSKKSQPINLPSNIIETFNLLQKKYSLQEIAKLRKLTEAVISMQIETIIGYLPETDISSILTDEKLNLIKDKYDKGITGLKDLKESLPKVFSYPEIRIALAKISHQLS